MKDAHPLVWLSLAITTIITAWTQFSPVILPHLGVHAAQIVTAVIALLSAIAPNKK